jgi:radical SAM superfamily enzyme YgiQ (UPF0313 family)
MPKVLLVQPTQYAAGGGLCKQRRIYLPGLALAHLAALTPPHWDVQLQLEVVDDVDLDTDADLVAIGSMGHATFRGLELARELRRRGKTVVMGGYMASMVPERVLDHVDAVVVGDAERAWPRLLADFERTGRIARRYLEPVDSLAGLPVPRYDLLLAKPIGGMLPVQAGRGCNHLCSFCSIACLYRGRYLTRPVDEVVRDVAAIRALGLRRFYLIDDNIVSNPRYLEAICEGLAPLKMRWATQCSLDLARQPRLLESVRRAGGSILSFGLESISQESLDSVDKAWVRVGDHAERLRTLTDAGLLVSTEMMVGLDGDTEASLRATADFVDAQRIPIPRFYILTPMPGTPLFDEYRAAGRLVTEDLTQYTGARAVHRPARMSPERLTELYWWLNDRVFSLRSILRRTLLHPRFLRQPAAFLFALVVNLHYRRYVRRRIPPNIF